jgi:hypothetical protein
MSDYIFMFIHPSEEKGPYAARDETVAFTARYYKGLWSF